MYSKVEKTLSFTLGAFVSSVPNLVIYWVLLQFPILQLSPGLLAQALTMSKKKKNLPWKHVEGKLTQYAVSKSISSLGKKKRSQTGRFCCLQKPSVFPTWHVGPSTDPMPKQKSCLLNLLRDYSTLKKMPGFELPVWRRYCWPRPVSAWLLTCTIRHGGLYTTVYIQRRK